MFKFSRQYLYLILLLVILMIPNLVLIAIGEDSIIISNIKKIAFLAFSIAFVIFPLFILKPKYYAFLSLFITFFIVFEAYVIVNYKAPSSEEIVATLFYTNYREGMEFLKSSMLYLVLFLTLFFSQVFLILKLKKSFKLPKPQKALVLIYVFLVLGVFFTRDYLFASNFELKETSVKQKIEHAQYLFMHKVHKVFPVSFYHKITNVRNGIKKIKSYNQTIKGFSYEAIKKDTLDLSEVYVLVIGETARKYNFGLLGYDRNTTPNLSKIENLFTFNDVKSAANLTAISMPFIVTRATPNNFNVSVEEPAILKAFEEAGFKTYWLTNQPTGLSEVIGFYSRLASTYRSLSASIDATKFDELLLPELDMILNDSSSKKKFIVIHTMGSHFRYNYRYPDRFKKFTPIVSKKLSLNAISVSYKKEFINSYDNSILYTDYILSEISNRLAETKSLSYMYYLSDHGENLYDDSRNFLMHGQPIPTKYEIDIPLIIWTSNEYKMAYATKTEILKSHQNSRISTVNTFHTLLDLANIGYKNENLKLSFANEKFDSLQPRYVLTPNKEVIQVDE